VHGQQDLSPIPASPRRSFNLKTAVDGREKAQNEKEVVETVVTHSVKVSVSAKFSFFCAFCAFSWLTAFSRFKPHLTASRRLFAAPPPRSGFLTPRLGLVGSWK